MKMFSKDGMEMMHVVSVKKIGNNLAVKGKMMRNMPATIYLKPDEMIKAIKLLSWRVVVFVPLMIFIGLWMTVKNRNAKNTK